jgi:hypothetical protein
MLKPAQDGRPGGDDESIGALATRLVDDAKAYARAEADLVKAIASDKAQGLKIAAVLLVAATFVAMGALNALCIGIFVALATLLGPLLGGIVAFVLIGAVAALLGWAGVRKLGQSL